LTAGPSPASRDGNPTPRPGVARKPDFISNIYFLPSRDFCATVFHPKKSRETFQPEN
jgi:hypothetical protein